jgi:cytochrome c biogenesis protein CcmG/thiol:disulfide interchange protein DsbE
VKRIVLIAVAVAVVVAGIVVYAQTRDDGAGGGGGGGEGSQTLAGTTLAGETFDLATTRGRPTVVNFFASWCPPCNSEAPDLVAFAAAHPEASFVGVAVNDERADTEAFVDKYGIAYPVVYDAEGSTGNDWGVTGIPTTFFLDAQGTIKDTIVGAASREHLEASLQQAL